MQKSAVANCSGKLRIRGNYSARPAAESGLFFDSVSYLFVRLFFNDFCHINYLKINQTDLRKIW